MSRNRHVLPWIVLGVIPVIGFILLAMTQTIQPAMSQKIPATSLTPFLQINFPTLTPKPTDLPVGDAAPAFSLKGLDGKTYRLEALRGKRILLNFWATWCAPCRIEMPLLETVYKRLKDKDFIILAVNNGEDADLVQRYRDELGLTFPILLDTDAAVFRAYGILGLPTTYFVDAKGAIVAQTSGAMSESVLNDYLQQLQATESADQH